MQRTTRMFLAMCLPAVGIGLASMGIATIAGRFSELPNLWGGQALWPGVADIIALAGGGLAVVLYAVAIIRYRRWEQGVGDCCIPCGCLLGRQRSGRFGPYRLCLGCGKNHSVGRLVPRRQ